MLVYANHLRAQGEGAKGAIFKAIGGWLKEQLGFGLHPEQLVREGDYSGKRVNPKTGASTSSWVKIYATSEAQPELYAWVLKNNDDTTPGRTWVTELGLKCFGNEYELSCIVRTDESSVFVTDRVSASRPRVIGYIARNLEETPDAEFSSQVSGLVPKSLGPDRDSYRALAVEIERPERVCPIVMVSPTWDGQYLVNVRHLQDCLLGLAQVVAISPDFDRYEMEEVLGHRWSAWNGAVNVLNAPSQTGFVWRRYFLADEIEGWGDTQHARVAEILGWVTNSTNVRQLHQRIRPEGVMQLAIRRKLQSVQENTGEMSTEELREQVRQLSKNLSEQAELQAMFEDDNTRLQNERDSFQQEYTKAEDSLRQMKHENAALKDALNSAGGGGGSSGGLNTALKLACRTGKIDPIECLDMIERAFGDRCIILDSARQSAQDVNLFMRGRTLLDMLRRLVTEYRDALLKGGDSQARQIFGKNEYAAKESETVMNNQDMRRSRTFEYKGKPIEMFRHLKIGAEDNSEKTIRVHFHWDSAAQKIVIGYCGQHLPIASH